ncbi:MAG TPA: rhodanese-related sulfurtransferase [Haploplasma sp.]|nr:rhodanese-related sulfurtransferase [Haploplasma sp.]
MNNTANYRVLLFYKYVTIDNPEEFTAQHLTYCNDLGIKGRILVSTEGINGTLSGTIEQTEQYMKDIKEDSRFSDMLFKMDDAGGHAFAKMHVRTRGEIVNFSLEDDINPNELTGNYLKPEEWLEAMNDPNTVIIDARNDYEYDLGHFRNAVKPEIRNFRQLPNWIRENKEQFQGKKILTYCTGGVRCEKFSGWLKREGFEDVNQLEGGIHTYGTNEVTQGTLWDGQMYVFDERLGVPINRVAPTVVGKDYFTNEPCERYVNCANPDCNKQIIISKETEDKYLRACSDECRVHPRNRYVLEHRLSLEEVNERLSQI